MAKNSKPTDEPTEDKTETEGQQGEAPPTRPAARSTKTFKRGTDVITASSKLAGFLERRGYEADNTNGDTD